MYRTIKEKLKEWKTRENRKPLLIQGARQVGKTYIIEEFARENYRTVIEINFQFDVQARQFFSEPRSYDDIISYIEINNTDKDFSDKKEVLLFFDEIQTVPELISELKLLKERCPYDVIGSGSMLGITMNRVSSFPVGYVETETLYPLSFKEFLLANRIEEKYIDTIRNCILEKKEIPEALHNRMNALFNTYLVVGGLPEAVQTYVDTGSVAEAIRVLRRLNSDYRNDIATYADKDVRVKAMECYDSLPAQLAKENKKFQYKIIREGYNARYYDSSLKWLESSGLIIKTNRLKTIADPLSAHKDLAVFKIYSFDTGLLISRFDDSVIQKILEDALMTYNGVVYENAASVMLAGYGYEQYYYEPNNSSEIDFVTYYKGEIIPVEVKSGLHTRSTSFTNFVRRHDSSIAFRFSKKNLGYDEESNIYYLPHYTMFLVFEEKLLALK